MKKRIWLFFLTALLGSGNLSAVSSGAENVFSDDAEVYFAEERLFTDSVLTGSSSTGVLDEFSDYSGDNTSQNEYSNFGSGMVSGLSTNPDGSFCRVEEIKRNGQTMIVADTYSIDGKCLDRKEIVPELPLIGGYFSGETSHYIVYGQENPQESDEVEVLRIVKYSKNWEREGAASIYGANTVVPFGFGICSCTEIGGKLYLHTSHVMYKTSDGVNHQANMSFVINEETMTVENQAYGIEYDTGYVSHSFYQAIHSDGSYIFRLDHGDAYPRGIVLTRTDVENPLSHTVSQILLPIQGEIGQNYTGVTPGGFELTEDSCIVTGTSVDQSSPEAFEHSEQRNLFYITISKELDSQKTVWITDYPEEAGIQLLDNKLIKLSEDEFFLLWREAGSVSRTMMALVDADGNVLNAPREIGVSLSYCEPFLSSSGTICWYLNNGRQLILYEVDPWNVDRNLIGCTVTCGQAEMYDGQPKTISVEVRDGEKILQEGIDYTLSFDNNIHASEHASAVLTGIGDYTGTVRKDFTIPARALNDIPVEILLGASCDAEAHKHITPEVLRAETEGKELKEGVDFTVETSYGDEDHNWLWINGMGDYCGYTVRSYFIHEMENVSNTEEAVYLQCRGCSRAQYENIPTAYQCWFGSDQMYGSYAAGPDSVYTSGWMIYLWATGESFTDYPEAAANNTEFVFESSDPSVARVEKTENPDFSRLYMVGEGRCTLTVYPKYNTKLKKTYTIRVNGPQCSATLSADAYTVTVTAEEEILRHGIISLPTAGAQSITLDTPGREEIVFEGFDTGNHFELQTGEMHGVSLRGYAVYRNINGEEKTIYSDVSYIR